MSTNPYFLTKTRGMYVFALWYIITFHVIKIDVIMVRKNKDHSCRHLWANEAESRVRCSSLDLSQFSIQHCEESSLSMVGTALFTYLMGWVCCMFTKNCTCDPPNWKEHCMYVGTK